ncbi:MAG: T9SS type A sorting domain-containing protein [Bacteroidia bacterium]|nr:T9SS type A sorting domain-containing protein [Bacteroidia bacterium]MDW8301007.1 T9SS type A sorting domain-containing protein [Bacteroidia bacterium]
MKKAVRFIFLLLALVTCFLDYVIAQSVPPKPAYPFNIKQLHCGHSLTDPLFNPWPGQYNGLVGSLNSVPAWMSWGLFVGRATLPGAWIKFHWDTTLAWCGMDPLVHCYEANMRPKDDIHLWDLLVITENMEGPLNLNANQSREHLTYFVNNSWQYGKGGTGAPTLLWTNWGGLDGSPYFLSGYGVPENPTTYSGWRQLLDSLELGWQAMQDYANANRISGCPYVYIIPGNRMMARFYDDIQANLVPGVSSPSYIFTDGVHLNDYGAYMVCMIHYACIFNANPVGLSNSLLPSITVPPAFATYVQNMVWNVVTNYCRSGLCHLTKIQDDEHSSQKSITIYPNPSSDYILVQSIMPISERNPIEIYDVVGKLIRRETSHPVDIRNMPSGMYWLKLGNSVQKFIKK